MRPSGTPGISRAVHRGSEVVRPAIHAGAVDIIVSVELAHSGEAERVTEALCESKSSDYLGSQYSYRHPLGDMLT